MNSIKTLFLLFAILATAVASSSVKSTKPPTLKSRKGLKLSKMKTAGAGSSSKGSKLSTKSPGAPTLKSSKKTGPVVSVRRLYLQQLLASHGPFNTQAFNWLADEDTWVPTANSPNEASLWIERLSLAVLYFSTNGDNWTTKSDWLSPTSVCTWYRTGSTTAICDNDDQLTTLALTNNNLDGTLPTELGQLTKLVDMGFSNNNLVGTLPTEFGQLIELTSLRTQLNTLDGTLPAEYLLLTQLTKLQIQSNKLTGAIPVLPSSLTTCNVRRNCLSDTTEATNSGCNDSENPLATC